MNASKGQSEGPATDRHNEPVVDPTKNVLELVAAANQRQDDLREAENKFWAAAIEHVKEMAALREEHLQQIGSLESKRIDAIRQVDVLAVNTAADRQSQAIATLATQTATNAETLRAMVATTATTIATQTAQTVAGITERISSLEKSSYIGSGRQAMADPALAQLVDEVRKLATVRDTTEGKSKGVSMIGAIIMGAALFLATMLSIGLALFALMKPAPVQPVAVPIVTPAQPQN